ncbi:MAG: hypothetical protein JW795_10825, partial [Chitinivibrionales bacterium]|nr:hypothetical protein [Chitinivibrionales bacterium]
TPPVLVAPAAIDADALEHCSWSGNLGTPQVYDNCSVASVSSNAPASFPLGQTMVLWQAKDGAGNIGTAQQIVFVQDRTAPVPTLIPLPQLTGESSVTVTATPTALDNCAGLVSGTTTDPLIYSQQGTYAITWKYDDKNGNISTQTQTIMVKDTTAPTVTCICANPSILWPPNHKLVPITVSVQAADNLPGTTSKKIITVTSNEPINGKGDGNTDWDWELTGDLSVKLRAERAGPLNDRIYTIVVECKDGMSNRSFATVEVKVPHDMSGKKKDDSNQCN